MIDTELLWKLLLKIWSTLSTLIKVGPYASIKAPPLREIEASPKSQKNLREIKGRHFFANKDTRIQQVTNNFHESEPYATLGALRSEMNKMANPTRH